MAIIGGGLAGLTAATALRRRGVPVILYEAGRQVSGLAASHRDDDGFTYDFGAHFITNRLAAALGLGARCRTVSRHGESVLIGGRTYSYPLGLLRNPRYALSGAAAQLRTALRPPAMRSAADAFRLRYGRALADEIAIPLLEAWSGAPATALSPAVAEKLQNGIGKGVLLKATARLTRRAVVNGYSHEVPENPHVWHVYPEDGLGLLCRHLAHTLDDVIRLEAPVRGITVDNARAVAVRVNGHEQPVAAVVSTAPCHILPKLIRGTEELGYLSRFRFRPMTFVNLRMEGRGLLPDTVLWTPESTFPFFRLTEAPISMPWLAPPDKTMITADIGCEVGDAIWSADDEQLGELCLQHLETIIPNARGRYLGGRALRTPIAYPVFLSDYEHDRQRFQNTTGIKNLISVGRNGEFAHILMEDVYWRTLRKTSALASQLASASAAKSRCDWEQLIRPDDIRANGISRAHS